MENYWNSYGVFIVATMIQNILGTNEAFNEGTDILWEKSINIYEDFKNSIFNVATKSEMDCINDYMQTINIKKLKP